MVKSHVHGSAVYYKQWSDDPSGGRISMVNAFNKKTNLTKPISVEKIGIEKGFYSDQLEEFFNVNFESKYDLFIQSLKNYENNSEFSPDLKIGIDFLFHFIFRRSDTLERMQKDFSDKINELKKIRDMNNYDPSKFIAYCKKRGFQLENPNICQSNIFAYLISEIGRFRKRPCVIKKIESGRLITCDDPVLSFDMKYGKIYLLTLDPTHYIILGYCRDKNLYNQVIEELHKFKITPQKINEELRKRAIIFVIL